MTSQSSQVIFSRIVPLVCQGLTFAPDDDAVWLEGLRMLADPKLRRTMAMTSSIWMPLLLKGIETTRSPEIILAGLRLLAEVSVIVDPMKSCFVKPLKALMGNEVIKDAAELRKADESLQLELYIAEDPVMALATSVASTALSTAEPAVISKQHPLLEEVLDGILPPHTRDVRYAWTHTLLVANLEPHSTWLANLYRATVEASGTPEMVITWKLDSQIHEDLFQTAFLMCYNQIEADVAFKEQVDNTLIRLLSDASTSKTIVEVFLELLIFLNKEKKVMSQAVVDAATACAMSDLGDLNGSMSAACLWYIEAEAERTMSIERIGDLVEANIRIGASCHDAAWSSLMWLQMDYKVQPDPMWITQLGEWSQALKTQGEADKGVVATFGSFHTRMLCYHALGQFEEGYELAQAMYEGLTDHERRKTSHWATAAAWHMGDYEAMSDYLAFHPKGTSKSLYKAIIDVNANQYAPAFQHISKAQTLAYDELQSVLSIGPSDAGKTLAKTEYLVELSEVMTYKSQPEQRQPILSSWRTRFKRSHPDSNSWLRRLQIWGLACEPTVLELQSSYLDCAKLCESQGKHEAAQKIIAMVTPEISPPGCKVEYTRLRFLWKDASERQDQPAMRDLLDKLHNHVSVFLEDQGIDRKGFMEEGLGMRPLLSAGHVDQGIRRTTGRRLYRLAQWSEAIQGPNWVSDPASEVYKYYSLAAKCDDNWFAGSYALCTSAMAIFESKHHDRNDPVAINNYIVPAIRGLFQAVRADEASPEKLIKALLRLVTIWFRYGESESVLIEAEHQLVLTPVSAWLTAIPQLIARLGTPHRDLQGVLIGLLKNIASAYPHAIIWPLLTASQSKAEHQDAARIIMTHISAMKDGGTLVKQAETIGRELIRVSTSWMEKWRNLIDKNLPRTDLMEIPWHELPEMWKEDYDALARPETPDEEAFVQRFGRRIESILTVLKRYRSTRSVAYINTAYPELHKLHDDLVTAISQQYKTSNPKLLMRDTAPRLLALRDCILTVPGEYDPQTKLDDQAFIDSFPATADILNSKMLPRKLSIRSWRSQRDDFTDFTFLLKGNEDLRGDERIMQLFSLINTLLNHNNAAFSRNLHLLPYQVVPLSPSAGLLSWVPNTQQLQGMIQANREKNKNSKLSDRELASMFGYDPETFDPSRDKPRLDLSGEMERYDKLTTPDKVKRLEAAWSHSKQSELKDILWQRSPSSEIWIRRRTNFARTLGVGSFVGHIIGLGDRHGSNILVDQLTWGALHIDFGDLFCVSQERSYLPEKVPFRLTRMMTNAFELVSHAGHPVPGTRGSYKKASKITMEVLRENRGTLLAMLEAFLYDPLLHWTANSTPSAVDTTPAQTTTQPHPGQKTCQDQSIRINAPRATRTMGQSVAPAMPRKEGDMDVYNRIDNSLVDVDYTNDSWVAKVAGGAMTNARALKVLATIERKLAGYENGSEHQLEIADQVQLLVAEATDPANLAQGYVLGWIPQW